MEDAAALRLYNLAVLEREPFFRYFIGIVVVHLHRLRELQNRQGTAAGKRGASTAAHQRQVKLQGIIQIELFGPKMQFPFKEVVL
jgi:hypothetical protein